MAHVPMESFQEGTEIVRVYLAATLREATAVEDTLAAAEVDFAVEVEEVVPSDPFGLRATRHAAGFWIRVEQLDRAVGALERGGQIAGLVRRER